MVQYFQSSFGRFVLLQDADEQRIGALQESDWNIRQNSWRVRSPSLGMEIEQHKKYDRRTLEVRLE